MIVTFDCYGTLIDWESGIIEAVSAAAQADGLQPAPAAIVAAHAAVEPEIQSGDYRPYRDVLIEAALAMAERLGWRGLTRERAQFLPASLPTWRPFADTNGALEQLRAAGYRLGILSNIDDHLFADTCRQFTVDFDLVVTAEHVRSYKPAPPHFVEARRLIGNEEWLHAAQSYWHDVEPAVAHGIPVAWVNRGGASSNRAARPDVEVASLAALVQWLEG